MRRSRLMILYCMIGFLYCPAMYGQTSDEIRLIIRGDDMGCAHAVNLACIQSYREGVVQSVEMMVPTPWFNEAVPLLNQNPGLDVGIHLTLTSEWENIKWGPLTRAKSLVDENGYFFSVTKTSGLRRGFVEANPDLDEVENELRTQIATGVRRVPHVSHLSTHMGTSVATPELRAVVDKLSREFGLPWEIPGLQRTSGRFDKTATPEGKVDNFVEILNNLKPGFYLFVEHPGLETPEMEAIGFPGYENVATDRAGVTRAFTSDRVKEIIRKRGIKLLSYRDALRRQ